MSNDENSCPQTSGGTFLKSGQTVNAGHELNKRSATNERAKESRGSKVFGNLVDVECDPMHSLSYSPSPTGGNSNGANKVEIPTPRSFRFEMEGCNSSSSNPPKASKDQNPTAIEATESSRPGDRKTKSLVAAKGAPAMRKPLRTMDSRVKSRDQLKQRMRKAVDHATMSVNESMNAVRIAKEEAEQAKKREIARLKEERKVERDNAEAFQIEAERTKKELLELKEKVSLTFRRAKVERDQAVRRARRDAATKEMHFNSEVFRAHKQEMKEAEDRRKRMSMEVRSKIRQENVVGKERIRLARIEEDQALLAERHESSVAMRTAAEEQAARRRQSLASRNAEGKRQRDEEESRRNVEQANEHESFELKWAGEKDAEGFFRQMAEKRRDSLAFRNQEGKRQRQLVEQERNEQLSEEHESYELKWAGEKDAKDYKKRLALERRNSLAFRNREGGRQRQEADQHRAEQLMADHESYELKWAGEKDAEEYNRQLAIERRESFEFRNEEGKRQRDEADRREAEERVSKHKDFELKWAGEKDAEAYRANTAQERRESLAFRNEEGRRRQEHADQERAEQLSIEHESYELKWAGDKDAEDYQKRLAQDRRDSFALRNKEGSQQRQEADQHRAEQFVADHESYELKWAGEKDADEYKRQLALERRESFEFRNAEGKRQRDETDRRKAEDRVAEHESFELKWAGEKDAEAFRAKTAQERRESLAFRNEEGRRRQELTDQERAEQLSKDHESYELKWAGDKDAEDYKKHLAQDRRDSFAFRNKEGSRQRQEAEQHRAEKFVADHESYELKWAGEKDTEEYERQLSVERRESFEFRNEEGKRQREEEDRRKAEERVAEHESFELKWAGEKDAEAYKAKIAQERRESLASRNEEGRRRQEHTDQERTEQLSKEHESYELKWAGDKDAEDYQKHLARERRDSFAFRNEEGSRQRQEAEQHRAEKFVADHESFELKWAGEKDAEEYKRQLAIERRESFEFSNEEGKRQREEEDRKKAEERVAEHESFELKWAGEKDASDYRCKLEADRRASLAFRNEEGKRQREVTDQLLSEERQQDHESYELKWAGERDAEAYQKELAKQRRESLLLRNQEGRRHRAVLDELQHIAQQKEHESMVLKWAGQDDVKTYLAEEDAERRKSLEARNQEGVRHRMIDQQNREKELEELAAEELLQAECQRDVEKYRDECAGRDRASLQLRREEARLQRMRDEELRQEELEKLHDDFELEAEARRDVTQYVKQCKKRDRLSLVFRAKEKRRHAEWEKEQADQEREALSRECRNRALDRKYVELAKEKERAQKAIEAIRHAGRSFAINPFSSLLE